MWNSSSTDLHAHALQQTQLNMALQSWFAVPVCLRRDHDSCRQHLFLHFMHCC